MSRSFRVFTGPIRDREGRLMLEEDEILEHPQILMMNWIIEGVVCSMPDSKGFDPLADLSTGRIGGS